MKKRTGFIPCYNHANETGSNLIGISILILAVGFLVAGGIFLTKNYDVIQDDQTSIDNFRDIQTALNDFIAREGRYPCPAPLNLAPDATAADGTEFGKEGSGACTGAIYAGTFRALGRDPDGAGPLPPMTVRIGAVPVRSLHLPDKEMVDGYGKRYIYAITEDLATAGTDVRNDLGAITINTQDGITISDAPGFIVYALISPGSDDRGAFDTQGNMILPCEAGTVAGNNCNFISNPSPNATFVSSTEKSFGTGSSTFTHSFAFLANAIPYKWNVTAWDECGDRRHAINPLWDVCFSGQQFRDVECRDHRSRVVADNFCNHTPKPVADRVCSLPPCFWDAQAWSTCGTVSPGGEGGIFAR